MSSGFLRLCAISFVLVLMHLGHKRQVHCGAVRFDEPSVRSVQLSLRRPSAGAPYSCAESYCSHRPMRANALGPIMYSTPRNSSTGFTVHLQLDVRGSDLQLYPF